MPHHECPIDVPVFDGDPWAPDVLADPYPTYREMRDLGPVVWLSAYGIFALPRFDDVRTALTSWQTFSSAQGVSINTATNQHFSGGILASDPPEHAEHRRPFAEQLSVNALRGDAPSIQAAAQRYVDRIVASGSFDGVADVAKPFSLEVVCDAVGIPEHCREHLPALAERAFNIMGPASDRNLDGFAALGELTDHAQSLVSNDELAPESRGARLVESTGTSRSIVIYTWPGIDTTVNGMSAALWAFAENPDEWAKVRQDRSLIPSAFSEALRLHTPVHYFSRTVTEPVDVEGSTLPAGSTVAIMYGSANRDERHYPDPDTFDATRNPKDQLAFGRGVHLCVGIHLARLEGHALLEALADRVERIEFDGDPSWIENGTLHGLEQLPLRIVAS